MRKNLQSAGEDDAFGREIDFSNAVRGKYAAEFGRMKNIRVLAPDLLEIFPDSESVNKALRRYALRHIVEADHPKLPKTVVHEHLR